MLQRQRLQRWFEGAPRSIVCAAMRFPFAFLSLLGALFLLIGCGDDGRPSGPVGNDSTFVGGACMDASECDNGLCQSGVRFPGSICTLSCGGSGGCPSGSSCAELDTGWVCLVNCMVSEECREQWVCEPVIEAGTNGNSTVSVCIGPAPAS